MRQLLDPSSRSWGFVFWASVLLMPWTEITPAAAQTGTVTRQATGSTLSVAIDPLPINGLKPILVNPLVVTLLPSGNPEVINANGRDVELKWPSVPVTDGAISIDNARHIVSIGGHFKPKGNSDNIHAALELRDQVTGGVAYLERMLIDITDRRHKNAFTLSDPDTIDSIHNTGDAVNFGGVVHATNPTSSHADGFHFRGPFDEVTFKDVHVSANYQGIFGAPAKNFHGLILDPHEQGGTLNFDNVTATVVEPPNLTAAEQVGWRYRATGYYLEAYNLRVESRQSFFDINILPGGMYLETPTTETQHWLNFIGGKLVLHDEVSPGAATLDYVPGGRLIHGRSPNIPTLDLVGPGSEPIYQ